MKSSLTIILLFFLFGIQAQNTVVDVIVNSEDHTVLEAAAGAAGLVETLQGDGPFTVFAPTDAAFAALPDGTVEGLLADPTGALTDILLYHVLGGQVLSTDLMDAMTATTLNGKDITVTINEQGVFINDAQVTVVDITTDNGVVHVIDAVLLPPTISSTRSTNYQPIEVKVFPNPAAEYFTIDWKGNFTNEVKVRMVNMAGQLTKAWTGTIANQEFSLEGLLPGLYFLEIISEDRRAIQTIVLE